MYKAIASGTFEWPKIAQNSLVAGGFWAVILSQAAWKKGWVGHDPTRSIIAMQTEV